MSTVSEMTAAPGAGIYPLRRAGWAALVPAALFLLFFFAYPLLDIFRRSVYDGGFTLRFYQRIIEEPAYFSVFVMTLEIAALVTLVCVVFGYPLAYFLNGCSARTRSILTMLIVFPFFTSVVVRTFAWIALLGRQGMISQFLQWAGIIDTPLKILYTKSAVVLGMAYILLPVMVLTIYSVMTGIDRGLVRAAYSLGASRLYAFVRIFLPLSLAGLIAGTLLVFIMSLGFFITPALLGGPSDVMIGMLVGREVELTNDWSFASALAVALLGVTLAGFVLCSRVIRLNQIFAARA
jgi:ABC-type spermidine/putrescine transport system permease subunit I